MGVSAHTASLTSLITFEAAANRFELGVDMTILDGSLPLPSGDAFNLYLDELVSVAVPEPGTLTLLATCGLMLS